MPFVQQALDPGIKVHGQGQEVDHICKACVLLKGIACLNGGSTGAFEVPPPPRSPPKQDLIG